VSASAAASSPEMLGRPEVVPEAEAAAARQVSPLKGVLKLLVATSVGKTGVVLFAIMLAISAYVLLTYPSDFGPSRWNNLTVWADNPKAVPPVWVGWLTPREEVEHQAETLGAPIEVTTRPQGELRTFLFDFSYDADDFPGFLSTTLTGLTFSTRQPSIAVTLIRPDGGQIRLVNVVVSAPRPDETIPYQRYYDTHERVLLTDQETAAQFLTQFYGQQYASLAYPSNLQARLNEALFGVPDPDGSGQIVPLPGDYVVQVQVLVADPNDQVAPIETVLAGTVYGVMGTDSGGRDLWDGLLYGFPVALLIAVTTALASTIIGTSLGVLSGYAGGATDAVIQRLVDIISNVPGLPLLIFLVFILGSHLWLIMLVLVAFSWTGLTIIVRTMVLQIRSGQLVEAAQALGASRWRIMLRHVFPQVAPFIVAQMIFFAPGAILAEAGLSFLGLGDVSIPTWGQMLQTGFQTGALYVGYWWWVLPPGFLIVFTALAFMLLALAMEPIVDPRLRQTT
jgi:peptide/nickel transport system permease protein